MTSRVFFSLLLAFLAFQAASCSGKKVDEDNPQELYKDAEEDIDDKRFAMALDKLKSIKNKFPYSHLATQAKLRIADVYYMEDSFIEAAGSYESFRDMHPKHDRADYVIFRIGESYFNQLPGGHDRDISPATKSLEAYRELLTLYPKSQFAEAAKSHAKEATETLAAKEQYVADFYFIREMFDSAATRYEKITSKFAGTEAEQLAYWRWGQSLIRLNKRDEAKHVYRTYLSRYPNGAYARDAGNWLGDAR